MEAPDDLILVDEQDRPIGYAQKLPAHQGEGRLHRAFSVFIFNSSGKMLLQRRAVGKYHFGGLWTNACCSHPRRGDTLVTAARLRLREEFGFDVPLRKLFSFVYRAQDPQSGLVEHEFDHVFIGHYDGPPAPNAQEIEAWRWVDPAELAREVNERPGEFTPWFKIALERVMAHVAEAQ